MIYNDFDKHACAWLLELISAGHLPEGTVDERSIADIRADEIRDARQFHTFAGIGGWPLALRLAGWPESVPVWTGSCPCQPFSAAGKRKGQDDERDLWPDFFRLIRDCRPGVVFGEQVASSDVIGTQLEADFIAAIQSVDFGKANRLADRIAERERNADLASLPPRWLDRICADLASAGYAIRAGVMGAHSVGAPHIRQRLYWVAYPNGSEWRPDFDANGVGQGRTAATPGIGREAGGLADAHGRHGGDRGIQRGGEHGQQPEDGGFVVGMGDPDDQGPQGHGRPFNLNDPAGRDGEERHNPASGFWSNYDIINCRDGKARRVESGSFPLANGIPGRVGLLRGYGNAIVPQVAAKFITAFMQSVGIQREGAANV
jgi:DNA (cytosine-5)-methyltransferase 1